MRRKKLMGWKRMAAFAMALTLTLADGASVGVMAAQTSDNVSAVETETEETTETVEKETGDTEIATADVATAAATEDAQTETDAETEAEEDEKMAEQVSVTTPGKVVNLRKETEAGNGEVDQSELTWDADQVADGYEIRIVDANGVEYANGTEIYTDAEGKSHEKLSYYCISSNHVDLNDCKYLYGYKMNADGEYENACDEKGIWISIKNNTDYTVQVRAYNYNNGATAYGEWSDAVIYNFPSSYKAEAVTGISYTQEDGRQSIVFQKGNNQYVELKITDAAGNEYFGNAYAKNVWNDSTQKYDTEFIKEYYRTYNNGKISLEDIEAYLYGQKQDENGYGYAETIKDASGNEMKAFKTGETYNVSLRGVTGDGDEMVPSDWSEALSISLQETAAPQVTGQLQYNIEDKIVSWNPVTGAEGYEVELKDAEGNWYNSYERVYDNTTGTYKYELKNLTTSSTSISVYNRYAYELSADAASRITKTDANGDYIRSGKAGTAYTIRVRAYATKKDSTEKVYSDWAELTYAVAAVTVPEKVTGVSVTEEEASWKAVSDEENVTYQVEIKDASGRLYTNYPESATDEAGNTTYDYYNYPSTSDTYKNIANYKTYIEQDGQPAALINTKTGDAVTSMEKGQTYTIRVRAGRSMNGVMSYGEWSDAYTYTVPVKTETEGINAKPAKVTGVWIQTESDEELNIYSPMLRWNKIDNVTRYEIEIKDSKGNLYSYSPDYYNNAYHTDYVDTTSNSISVDSLEGKSAYTEAGDVVRDASGNEMTTFASGETYTIRVRAVNRYREYNQTTQEWSAYTQYDGDWSEAVTYTPAGKVTALKSFKLSREDEDYYYFSYKYNVDNFDGDVYYQIATDASFSDASLVQNWKYASDGTGDDKLAISKTRVDLKPSTMYYVRVVASTCGKPATNMEKSRYESILSTAAVTSFTTNAQKTPKNITGLKIYSESAEGYKLRFDAVLDEKNGDEFEIQLANDANSANWSALSTSTWIDKDDLPEGTSYIRAVAYVNVYNSETQKMEKVYGQPSNVVKIKKNTTVTTAIGNVALAEENSSSYTFSYSGKLRTDERVEFWYSDSKKFETNKKDIHTYYGTYSTSQNKKINLSKDNLTPGKTYYVKMRTVNSNATKTENKYSAFSNVVKVKAAVPEISVNCNYVTKDSITLTMGGSGKITGYEIQKKSVKNKKTVWTTVAQTSSPSYTDSKLKADTTYSYRVRPYFFNTDTNKTVKGTWEYCEAMTGWGGALKLHATAASKTSVKLSWSKISGTSGYEVYKYVGGSSTTEIKNGEGNSFSKYKLVTSLSSKKNSYTDKNLTGGMRYYYIVKAYKNVDGKKVYVEDGDSVALDFTLTKVSQYQKSNGKVTVTWDPVYEADGYLIEKQNNASGKWSTFKKIKKAKTSSYTFGSTKDTDGVNYRIRAYSGKKYTNAINVTVEPVLTAPTRVTAKATKNGIKVSWKAVKGADYYRVFRTEVKDAIYNKDTKSYSYTGATEVGRYVADSSKVSGYRYRDLDDMNVTSVEDREITYSANGVTDIMMANGPETGVKYYYYVVAYKNNKATDGYVISNDSQECYESGASEAASATFKEKKPATTSITKISSKSKNVTLKYKKSKTADGYEIQRSTNKKKGFKTIKDINKVDTVSYVDKNSKKNELKKGKTYYYRVRAYKYNEDGSKVYSSYSSVKSVKIK